MVHKEKQQLLTAAGGNSVDGAADGEDLAAAGVGVCAEGEEAQLGAQGPLQLGSGEDIAEMDRTIQEKEEILLKLQETVKGYVCPPCLCFWCSGPDWRALRTDTR
jgi:hypothetical protein